jgi:hypothetical protein
MKERRALSCFDREEGGGVSRQVPLRSRTRLDAREEEDGRRVGGGS